MKIAIVISHPVQHFCPMYASWASIEGIELKVFFGSNLGAVKYIDINFNKEIQWNNLYLDNFSHEFLNANKTLESEPSLDSDNLDSKLSEFAPELLIHYGYFHKLAKHARSWAIKNKVKIAYISDAEHRQKRPFWKEILKFPFLYFFFKKEDYFFSVGDANEKYYSFYGVPKEKMKRMHFAIDIRNFDIAFENKKVLRNNFRNHHNISAQAIVLSVVGKLVDSKSQDHLIKLLLQLEQFYPSQMFHLLIAGSGPMEKQWKELATNIKHNKIHFLGFVSTSNLPTIYAASDIYVHPSMRDAHSLSISEAIYMGCPIIVSNTCGSWGDNDDVQIGKNGYVYQYGNLIELQQQIFQIINKNKLETFGEYSIEISRKFQQQAHFHMIKNLKLNR
jgi:glycosyltransferase involved in cell wall biosynthesis